MQRWQQISGALALVFVLLAGIGVLRYDNLQVVNSAMDPTLGVGADFSVRSGQTPAVNDIIVFDVPQNVGSANGSLLMRLVAVGGQEVTFADGELFIDGARIVEPFLLEQGSTDPLGEIPGCTQQTPAVDLCLVPDGFGFVMGDNRRGSTDSRFYGPIDLATVKGVVTDPPFWFFTGLLP